MRPTAPYPAYARFDNAVVTLPRMCESDAIKHAIWRQMGGEGNPELDYVGREIFEKTEWTVGVVRDPIDRLISCWRDKVMQRWMPSLEQWGISKGMPFEAFVGIVLNTTDADSNRHFRSFSDELLLDGGISPKVILTVEELDRDWYDLETLFGWPHLGIEKRNLSSQLPVRIHDLLLNALRDRYQADYDLLDKAHLYQPRQYLSQDKVDANAPEVSMSDTIEEGWKKLDQPA